MKLDTVVHHHHQSPHGCCPVQSVKNFQMQRVKNFGESRQVYIFGVDRLHDEGESSFGSHLSATTGSDDSALQLALQKNEDLQQEKIADMEQQKHSAISHRES